MPTSPNTETSEIRISIEDALLAALEGSTVTHSHTVADSNLPYTYNTTVMFEESPDEIADAILENGAIRNRMGHILEDN